jgi:KUP system potassium uptake protein
MRALVIGAIGVVFGDIGTSPLYTLEECLHGKHGVSPERANVFGVLSLIVWSITLVVTLKYIAFLMRADNQGEGGIMALLALTPRKERRAGRIGVVAALVIVGAALLYGDGIITPAISVLSAMEGLHVATDRFDDWIVPLTVVILIGLFAVQSRGTGGIGKFFGPVMVTWFVVLGVLGIVNIARDPHILGALLPHHAVRFFVDNKFDGFRVLGGVVLAVTGGEALYADMGHFGRLPIRRGWLYLVFPSLILCYFGQGAAILIDKHAAAAPFYALFPRGPWIYPAVALASAATVIASQALISGVFSLTHQAIRLGYLPRLTITHTSGEAEGQIYVPLLNWFLAIACILLVVALRQSSRLAAAYGLAVSGTMAITSIVFYVVTRNTWKWSLGKALAVLLLFLSFDVPFLVANALKFFDGGYLPFAVGVGFTLVMVSWKIGRSYLAEELKRQAPPLEPLLARLGKGEITRSPGTAIVLSAQSSGLPPVLARVVRNFGVLPERVVLTTVSTERVPAVDSAERVSVEPIAHGVSRATLRFGFMEIPHVPPAVARALEMLGDDTPPDKLAYLLGRETLVVTRKGRMDPITEPVFALLARNAHGPSDDFGLPTSQVVEIGTQLDL